MELFTSHGLELLLIILGFGAGVATNFRLPFMLTIFMIRIIKWWMDTHPHGQQMKRETNLDEYFERVFGIHLKDEDNKIPSETQAIDNKEVPDL